MSGSSFDWADDVIEEAEMLQNSVSEVSKDETPINELIPDPDELYDSLLNTSMTSSDGYESTETSDDLFNISDNETKTDDREITPCSSPESSPEPSPEPEQPCWGAAEAIEQGKFDQWATEAYWNVEMGFVPYHRLLLPARLAGWEGEEVPSRPKPKDTHLTVVNPSRMLPKMPYLERSFMGCLTYDNFDHKNNQQQNMRALGIEEKEVPLSNGEKLKLVLPSFNRWVCQPNGMRNSWTMV